MNDPYARKALADTRQRITDALAMLTEVERNNRDSYVGEGIAVIEVRARLVMALELLDLGFGKPPPESGA